MRAQSATAWSVRYRGIWAVLVALLAGTPAAEAAVTCTASATSVVFGIYNPLLTTATTSTGTFTASCSATRRTNVTLVATFSTGVSGSYSPRNMKSGTNMLSYNLYQSTAYTQAWGDGTGGTSSATYTVNVTPGTPSIVSQTIYGMIPSGQNAAAGSYTDTIVLTVTY